MITRRLTDFSPLLCVVISALITALSSTAHADSGFEDARPDAASAIDQAHNAAIEAAESPPPSTIDADVLDAVVDAHMERNLFDLEADADDSGGLATGAIFAAVDGHEVLRARGYGYADVDQTPIDAAKTTFNIGSATTSLTAVAAFNTIDDEDLALDTDVEAHLDDFDLPDGFDEAITLRHLLDHTAGFYESTTGVRTPSPDDRADLGEALRDHFPNRTRRPATQYQHSHHGAALAGYLVETTREIPFTDVLTEAVFEPLEMDHTFSSATTTPGEQTATGHTRIAGEIQPQRRRGVQLSPVDGVHTTAEDVAALMDFLVNGDDQVLSPDLHHQMLETSFRPHPEVAGVTPGFKEILRGDQRWLLTVGESPDGFASLLVFSPEHDFGFFVAYNSDLGSAVRFDLVDELLDELFPVDPPDDTLEARAAQTRVDEVVGTYRLNRTVDDGFMKPLGQMMSVRADVESVQIEFPEEGPDGPVEYAPHNLQISHPLDPEPSIWVPIVDDQGQRDLWRHEDGQATLVVERDDRGQVIGFSHDHPDLMTFHRTSWYDSGPLIGGLMAAFFTLFVAVTIVGPVQAIRRRFASETDDDSTTDERRRWLAVFYGVLATVFFVGYGIIAGRQVFGVPDWAPFIFVLPFVLTLLAPLLVLSAVQNYRQQRSSPLGRVFYATVAAGAALLPVFFVWWDLFGFQW